MLGLDSDSVIARIKSEQTTFTLPTLKQSVFTGTIGFTIVSLLMFGVWAMAAQWMYENLGAKMFYALLGIGFMAGGGGAFAPLLIGNNLGRFYALYISSFFVYATVWMVSWFTLKAPGEWLATVFGPGLMGALFVLVFGASAQLIRVCATLIVGHTLGYFIGEWLFYWEPLYNRYGMMLWGLTYGIGFGSAIAAALYWCQTDTRDKLAAIVRSAEKPSDSSESDNSPDATT